MATGTELIPTAPITESTTLSSVRWFSVVVALAAGCYLAVLGMAGLATQRLTGLEKRTIANIQRGVPVDPPAREAARTVLRMSGDGSQVALAGILSVDQAVRVGLSTADGRIWLNRAIADLRRGLTMAPADGLAWLRLAGAEYLMNGPSQSALSALKLMSFTRRNNADGAPLFLSMAAELWPRLEPDIQSTAKTMIMHHWNFRRGKLDRLALSQSGRQLLKTVIGDTSELNAWIQTRIDAQKRRREEKALGPKLRR